MTRGVLLAVFVVFLCIEIVDADEPKLDAIYAGVVKSIVTSFDSAELVDSGIDQESDSKWIARVMDCRAEFNKLLGRRDERVLVRRLFGEFGTRGAKADFAILMAIGRFGLPSQSGNTGLVVKGIGVDRTSVKNDWYRSKQLMVAEIQTEWFISHPDKLERYLYYMIWSGQLKREGFRHYKQCCASGMATGAYWWHARNALLLMSCDNWSGPPIKEANEIHSQFSLWLGSSSEFDITIFDERPQLPFPDWTGPKPPSGHTLREFYDLSGVTE